MPSRLLRSKLLLCLKVACGDIVGLDYEMGTKQVMPPSAQAMDYGSHLLLMHRVSPLGVKAIGCPSCISTPPMAKSNASVCTSNGLLRSGSLSTGSSIKAFFKSSKACWHRSVHSHVLFFFKRSVKGAAMAEYPLMNLR